MYGQVLLEAFSEETRRDMGVEYGHNPFRLHISGSEHLPG
jgi:hypothetical protein